jgi:hypothetical protein
MERQAKYTLETVPIKTLLHYVKKDEIVKSLPPGALVELQRQATQQGEKLTAKFLKQAVLQNADFMNQLRGSQVGFQAFQKYLANYQRITAPETRAKSRQVRQEMVGPRQVCCLPCFCSKGGCLLSFFVGLLCWRQRGKLLVFFENGRTGHKELTIHAEHDSCFWALFACLLWLFCVAVFVCCCLLLLLLRLRVFLVTFEARPFGFVSSSVQRCVVVC